MSYFIHEAHSSVLLVLARADFGFPDSSSVMHTSYIHKFHNTTIQHDPLELTIYLGVSVFAYMSLQMHAHELCLFIRFLCSGQFSEGPTTMKTCVLVCVASMHDQSSKDSKQKCNSGFTRFMRFTVRAVHARKRCYYEPMSTGNLGNIVC